MRAHHEVVADLEKFEEVVVGRELKMIALEKDLDHKQREIERLLAERTASEGRRGTRPDAGNGA